MAHKRFRTTPPDEGKGSILLIDDSELLVEIVTDMLECEGFVVRSALSGEAALLLLAEGLPDMVVCDLNMPGMSGMEVMQAIHDKDPEIPVIMLSGSEELTSVLAAVRKGAFDYVTKTGDYAQALAASVTRANQHLFLQRENTRLTSIVREANRELAANLAELDKQHKLLIDEKARSEALLRNVLPGAIADRLRATDERIADGFSDVTVLFADITDFSAFASTRSPQELVLFLNEVFSDIDRIAIELGVEKIKTIGDAYMAATGLPLPRKDHAQLMLDFAQRMRESVAKTSTSLGHELHLRIGMHSGPVVAGIVGESKFCYDLWGDTVNLASRMESHGVKNRIHLSAETVALLEHLYDFESRGPQSIKGYGARETFLLA